MKEMTKKNLIEQNETPTQEESEEVKECGQPLDVKNLPYTKEHDYIISRINGAAYEVKFGPQDKGNVPKNPFASLAQERYMHANPEVLGKEKLAEFDAATKGKKLPKRVKGRK
jgi:hypothetical protein